MSVSALNAWTGRHPVGARRRALLLAACGALVLPRPAAGQRAPRPFEGVLTPDPRPIRFVSGDVRLLIPHNFVTTPTSDGDFPDRPGQMAGVALFPGPRGVERETFQLFFSPRFPEAGGVRFAFSGAQSALLDERGFQRGFVPGWRDPALRWVTSEHDGLVRLEPHWADMYAAIGPNDAETVTVLRNGATAQIALYAGGARWRMSGGMRALFDTAARDAREAGDRRR